jgi:three-Cys-motif partner protein
MTQNAEHFDEFEPHTRLKHAILNAYIPSWAMKLLLGGATNRLAIVDAFAGAGRDKAGNDGSPLIAVKRAQEVMLDVRARSARTSNATIHVFAIENHRTRFRQLEQTMEPYRNAAPDLIHILPGELSDHVDRIRQIVGDAPSFYFLDPFGIKGLDAATYPAALRGPRNEIFALFADIGAIRLHGLVTAGRADATSRIEAILASPGLFPELDAAEIESAQVSAMRTNEALDASAPASREHLTRALGSDQWVAEVGQAAASERPNVFLRLFREALIAAGARNVLSVPMRNDLGRHVYALVHASKSVAGLVAMKESVSTGLRSDLLSEPARAAMKSDLAVDIVSLLDTIQRRLASLTVPWAEKDTGLRDLLLAHTGLFQFQMDEVKAELRQRGLLKRIERREVCVFPAAIPRRAPLRGPEMHDHHESLSAARRVSGVIEDIRR